MTAQHVRLAGRVDAPSPPNADPAKDKTEDRWRPWRRQMFVLHARGQIDPCRERLEALAGETPLTTRHLGTLVTGFTLIGDHDRAAVLARQWTEAAPGEAGPRLALARALLAADDPDAARQVAAGAADGRSIELMMGRLANAIGRYAEAERILEPGVGHRASGLESRLELAWALSAQGRTEQGLLHVRHAAMTHPDDPRPHLSGARIALFAGDDARAVEHLTRIDLETLGRADPALRAQMRLAGGEFDAALGICDTAMADGVADPALHLIQARCRGAQMSFDEAELHYEGLVRMLPNSPLPYDRLAAFYLRRGAPGRTLWRVDLLTEGGARTEFCAMVRAVVDHAAGRHAAAQTRLRPVFAEMVAQRRVGVIAVADVMRDLGGADVDPGLPYATLIDADLHVDAARMRLADLALARGDAESATRLLDRLEADAEPADVVTRLALLERYRRSGSVDGVLALLERWSDQGDSTRLPGRLEAMVLIEAGRYGEAAALCGDLAARAPEDASLHRLHAQSSRLGMDFAGAIEALGRLDGTRRDRLECAAYGAHLLAAIGLFQQAERTLADLDDLGSTHDPRVNRTLGEALLAIGQSDRATRRFDLINTASPGHASAQVLSAVIDRKSGRFEKARWRLEQAFRRRVTAAGAVNALVELDARIPVHRDLLAEADDRITLSDLPSESRGTWIPVRASVLAERQAWQELAALLGGAEAPPDLVPARIAVLLHLGRVAEAARTWESAEADHDAPLAPLIAAMVRATPRAVEGEPAFARFVRALVEEDLDAARVAAARPMAMDTVFEADLLTMLDGPTLRALETRRAARRVAIGLLAFHAGLPGLTEFACRGALAEAPHLALTYGLFAHLGIEQQRPTDLVRESMAEHFPESVLEAYLDARQSAADGDVETAAERYLEVRGRAPEHDGVALELARSLAAADRVDEALSHYRRLAGRDGPRRAVAAGELARWLLLRSADVEPVRALVAGAGGAEGGDPVLIAAQGWLEHLEGEHQLALRTLNRAVLRRPDDRYVHYRLGRVYDVIGNRNWARFHLQQALTGPDRPWSGDARTLLERLGRTTADGAQEDRT
ncbi:MAG: hypothetical protein CMJ18_05050 [Phycisphaeraceae bacterium]|nr:hypothetical protein [Phycisphaeraceae bacterium]